MCSSPPPGDRDAAHSLIQMRRWKIRAVILYPRRKILLKLELRNRVWKVGLFHCEARLRQKRRVSVWRKKRWTGVYFCKVIQPKVLSRFSGLQTVNATASWVEDLAPETSGWWHVSPGSRVWPARVLVTPRSPGCVRWSSVMWPGVMGGPSVWWLWLRLRRVTVTRGSSCWSVPGAGGSAGVCQSPPMWGGQVTRPATRSTHADPAPEVSSRGERYATIRT